ncbi:hypothetical protein [Anaeromicropila herbilytica]|uniref:Uncharacterized protein n=1 Tax=Anaeromicropila herbilytica TaxID=2785025 RepID=A0A7R7EP01_9FIRM|nr:hypothetical protein [Anaeromicropila herbilytica]BCN32400.1 hypothetical protein bsdtb5_36950 [Anaeromicropila herbilytica]
MVNINGKILKIGEKSIEQEHTIQKYIEYLNQVIVLIYDDAVIANNVISYDKEGHELWKINDILNVKRPTGNVDIEKESEKVLIVCSSLGIKYKIEIEKKELIEKIFLR